MSSPSPRGPSGSEESKPQASLGSPVSPTLSEHSSGPFPPKAEEIELSHDTTLPPATSTPEASRPAMVQSPVPSQPASQGWRFWAVFLPMCMGTLLAAVETTVTSTALPSIVADLESGDLYVWILNGYLLTRCVASPSDVRFLDRRRRRLTPKCAETLNLLRQYRISTAVWPIC